MRVLVVEREAGDGDASARELESSGHEVLRCVEPGAAALPCKGHLGHEGCPLDHQAVDVALAVRGNEGGPSTDFEAGVRCALRQGVPVMVLGNLAGARYAPWVDDVAGMAEPALDARVTALAHAGLAPVADAATQVARQVLDNHDLDAEPCEVVARHDGDRLVIRVGLPHDIDDKVASLVAARVLSVVPSLRPGFERVDVSVSGPTPHGA